MALLQPPSFMQARTDHTAQEDRLGMQGIVERFGGIGFLTNPLVRQTGAASLAVLVGRERFYIPGTENTHQGNYHTYNDADVTVSLGATAGHATLVRIDMLVAEVRDSAYSGANNDWQFRIVPGTAGSGVKPTLPINAIEIATITMPALASTILTAYIANTARVATMRGAPLPILSTAIGTITNPYDGMTVWYTDLDQLWCYNSSTWTFIGGRITRTNEAIRSTSNTAADSYASGSYAGLLTVTLPANSFAGRYAIALQFCIGSTAAVPGNIRVMAGATNLSYDAQLHTSNAIVLTQPWLGSFLHSGGTLSIIASHQLSSGTATVINASTKMVVTYLGPE